MLVLRLLVALAVPYVATQGVLTWVGCSYLVRARVNFCYNRFPPQLVSSPSRIYASYSGVLSWLAVCCFCLK